MKNQKNSDLFENNMHAQVSPILKSVIIGGKSLNQRHNTFSILLGLFYAAIDPACLEH